MKNIILLVIILQASLLSAQNKKKPIDVIHPEVKSYTLLKNSFIKIRQDNDLYFDYEIKKGNKLVFEYNYKAKDRESVADDEFRERIVFEVEPNQDEFILKDSSLLNANACFTRSCFCIDRGNYKINGGSIIGKKTNTNTWKINMDLIITPTQLHGGEAIKTNITGIYKLPVSTKKISR